MISEGEAAPAFELPAVVSGEFVRVGLDEFLGAAVIILVFYPADFNPACTTESTDLDGFDVFAMQQDAVVLGICGDSVYSHHAFAERYDLTIPLLADIERSVADAYDIPKGESGYATQRAVVVIDHDGTVVYAWAADDIDAEPEMSRVRTAFSDIEDAEFADTEYRNGCDRYGEARAAFVEGMQAYERRDWVLATTAFEQALERLSETHDAFESAIRFSERQANTASFEVGLRSVEAFIRAVKLFVESANEHANQHPQHAQKLQREAERVLTSVRELGAPPEPDEVPIDVDIEQQPREWILELDPDGEVEMGESVPATEDTDESVPATENTDENEPEVERKTEAVEEEAGIDDDELDELTAEIEKQAVGDTTETKQSETATDEQSTTGETDQR